MREKPDYLGSVHAARFQEQAVADAYHLRPSYPAQTFDILVSLLTGVPRTLLDAGTGTGAIARPMAPLVERVDAVDFSQAMMQRGKHLPGGNHPHLHWIYGRIEDAPLSPPYALITAGQSLHWMEWSVVLPRFKQVLNPEGFLAIVNVETMATPWNSDLVKVIRQYTTNPHYQPINLITELEERGLFRRQGAKKTTPVPFVQSLADYIESFHARSSLSRVGMGWENAAAFDRAVRDVVARFTSNGRVQLQIVGDVVWGKPL